MDTLRNRLRATTAPHHERVDAAFSAYPLDRMDGYRAFLQAHAQALIPLEIALEQSGIETMIADWPQRSRRQELLEDLQAICGAVPTSSVSVTPPLSAGWCWGAAYVMEGSRLGGRVLARRVAEANPSAPLSYLGHRSATSLWPSFLQQFERQAAMCAWSDVVAGAHDTFDSFLAAARIHRP
jgi:heme oxygenase (biliverdin-IX-beta and delta-forming)